MKKIFNINVRIIEILLLTISILWLSESVIAQSVSNSKIQQVQIQIDADSSELKINGTTNVNTFTCAYQGELPEERLKINVIPSDTSQILRGARLKLKVTAFDCGKKRMSNDLYELLQYQENPYIYLDIAEIWKNVDEKKSQYETVYQTQTIFTIAGNTEKYQLDVVSSNNHPVTATGEHELNITDFGLTPPKKFLGMIKVDKMITIKFKLNIVVDIQPES